MNALGRIVGLPPTIGRYRVVGRLGRGAMGIVYSGRDDQLERDVALKVMMADIESDPETRARFYREAQITGKLLHRNIITVFDLGEENGRLYLVMELLKGRTLGEFLNESDAPSLEEKMDLMIQTCEGLASAHARGIVHRDIKPSNLFVQADGALKILDFGIARLASSNMTVSGMIMGTPDYMSPEQAQGRAIDPRSDVFSAAGVFYLMVTGRRPFEAAELPAVLRKVVREDPLPIRPHEAPPVLAQIITKALQKDPAQRYQRAADMAADIVRFRRQFDHETRRIIASAKEHLDRIHELLAGERELRTMLGLEIPKAIEALQVSLDGRYPFFGASREDGAVVAPPKRHAASAMLDDLKGILTSLSAGVDALRAAVAAVESGERALEDGDPRAALASFERAATELSPDESPRVAAGAAAARAAIVKAQELADRVSAFVAEARAAERRSDWRAVVELCAQTLAIDPNHAEALALAARGRAAAESERQATLRQLHSFIERGNKEIERGHFEEADRILDDALALHVDDEAVKSARKRLSDARQAVSAADARLRHAASELVAARAIFEAGDRQVAIHRLEVLAREEPSAPGVAAELRAMVAAAERLAADEHRRAQATAHVREATDAWERGEARQTLEAANAALALEPAQPDSLRLQSLAKTRLRTLAEAAARSEQAASRVAKARKLLGAGRFEKAAKEAQVALDLEPGRADAALIVSESRRLEQEAASARVREEMAVARSRKAEEILKVATKAIRAGHFDRAAWAAENALLEQPGHPRAQEILAQARAALVSRGHADPDDTVKLAGLMVSVPDSADTVVMDPADLHRRMGS